MNSTNTVNELVIIGAGPAALTAAIYTAREDIKTLIYEKTIVGGLAATTDWIDNFPGYREGVSGIRFAEEVQAQAERFGAKIDFGDVQKLTKNDDTIELTIDGEPVYAKSVLIATGSDHKKLGVPGEAEYHSRGVHYCATCDGAFYSGKRIAVIGGGNSGVQEAIFLTRFADHIDLLVRSELKADRVLIKQLESMSDKITVHTNVNVDEITTTDDKVDGVAVTRKSTGKEDKILVDGVFVFIGLLPNTGFLQDSGVELDESGFVIASTRLETSVPGIFVAGDVRSDSVKQVVSAAGDGAVAALNIREYLDEAK
jgi:thioredoxin reductase (NADPH)